MLSARRQHVYSPLQCFALVTATALAALGVAACASHPPAGGTAPTISAVAAPASAAPASTTALHPAAIAFISRTRGVVAGQIVTNPLKIAGASVLEITSDGGKTWRLVYRPSGPVVSMSVVTPNHIWALAAQGYGKGAPTHLLASSDGGATWKRVGALQPGMKELAFVSRDLGYAVRLDVFHGGDHAPWTLVKTTDGGQTWQAVGRAAPAGTSAVAVSFVDPHQGWLLRMDQPGAGQQSRELLETRNGGHSWRRVAGTLSPSAIPASSTDGLGTGGYPGSLFFLADGHGWIGLNYAASVIATKDGGRHWQPAGSRLSDYGAGPVWFLNDRRGFAIVGSANDFRLLGTRNGGSSWAVVHKWVLPD